MKDMENGTAENKTGFSKIRFCRDRALHDNLEYFWVDMCCIDKSNSTKLQEAINSTFRWHRDATKCYVFLADVSTPSDIGKKSTWRPAFRASRWFTRGWTLQELLAPASVQFFSKEGVYLGDKESLQQDIHEVTGIPRAALQSSPLSEFSISTRMEWIAKRNTTRGEDKAYSLLGIFDVHIPLIYGEEEKNAFRRLRHELGRFLEELAGASINEKVYDVAKYDDPAIRALRVYHYPRIRDKGHQIRLLRLLGGGLGNPEITGQLFDVELDRYGIVREVGYPDEYQRGRPVQYEVLSGSWGTDALMYGIRIIGVNGQAYRHRVTRELASALKSRRRSEDRILWLEVICTNQEDYEERNRQVQMTASIYNSAFQVCVWLGQDNGNFEPAVIFIQEIMQMGSFDSISNDKGSSSKKLSLLQLMQRPWFSTHRAIQDIALARQATLYCGWEELSWEHLAVAIEFLLEEEAVTHCQSEITTTQEVSKYVSPISTFGASILVQATPNTFHRNVEGTHNLHTPVQNIPRTRKSRTRKKKGNPSMRHLEVAPSVYSPPRPLLSLEHLVSRFSAFKSPHPMDAIYSFLAISKDTSPLAEDFEVHDNSMEALMSKIFSLLRHSLRELHSVV